MRVALVGLFVDIVFLLFVLVGLLPSSFGLPGRPDGANAVHQRQAGRAGGGIFENLRRPEMEDAQEENKSLDRAANRSSELVVVVEAGYYYGECRAILLPKRMNELPMVF